MAKYGRIRSVYGMYTVVYDTVYAHLGPYTESVTVDLGNHPIPYKKIWKAIFFSLDYGKY
jgi:hypothetical protein